MTAQLLTSELSTLITESKRKNTELRTAAEKSLNDLKALPRTSEAQIAADLKCRPAFVKPFLLACTTRNPKFAGSATVCLQRLVVANALPKESLADVLEAFRECSTLALDIQLKVLQALPSLLQNYARSLNGTLLVAAFQVCFLLYSSKTLVVSNTAAAAIQQLVNATLEKSSLEEDEQSTNGPAVQVSIGDGTTTIYGTALDACRLLEDTCLLTDGQKPKFLPAVSLAQNFGLELLESILASHMDVVMAHPEQIHVVRLKLMPLILKILSDRASFPTTVRSVRLLQLIFSRLLFALAPECEVALSLLNHMLDADAATLWKRALCLEVFRGIYSEPALVRSIYSHYDEAEEQRNIVRDHLGSLVRLASEKPAIIGLGQQSSVPDLPGQEDFSGEQAALQAGGLIGSIGTVTVENIGNKTGISNQWSTVRIPCIDQLDKSEAPALPATYIYSLALTCITTFSDGLARFLLPFTVPTDHKAKRKQSALPDTEGDGKLERTQSFGGRRIPVNPLTLKEHVLYGQITTSGHMVDQCWPALLAASSTYLNAALDSENYHALVRSFQKFTQIAGLLDLSTPRDAFLTTLGKHAVPPMNTSVISLPSNTRDTKFLGEDLSDSDWDASPAALNQRRRSQDRPMPAMNTRHLLCLRALLNLGIALGPVLQYSWNIILEALQQADLIISLSAPGRRKQSRSGSRVEIEHRPGSSDGGEGLGLEITAAETAASRLFESTADLPNEAFRDFLKCISSLLQMDGPEDIFTNFTLSPQPAGRKHLKRRSISGVGVEGSTPAASIVFILDKLHVVMQSNIIRLIQPDTSDTGWKFLLETLINLLSSSKTHPEVRIKATNVLNELLVAVAISEEKSPEGCDAVRGRSLEALSNEISALGMDQSQTTRSSRECEMEIHRLALEALKSILEHCGDSLDTGWTSILLIINSIFGPPSTQRGQSDNTATPSTWSPKLIRSAFGSLQLICSDFLGIVSPSHLLTLLDTLQLFCAQDQDLNISLTTATFFRNVSDFLQRDGGTIDFEFLRSNKPSETDLKRWANDRDRERCNQALWLYLLQRVMLLSTDSRLEVRHSSLHTLFRIFDASGDQLSVPAVQVCFQTVLGRLLASNEVRRSALEEFKGSETVTQGSIYGWDETAIIEIEGLSSLFSTWLDVYKGDKSLVQVYQELFGQFIICLKRQSMSVANAVFAGMSKILAEVESLESLGKSLVYKAWQLWKEGNPASHHDDSQRKSGNQDALVGYLLCLKQLLRLIARGLGLDEAKTVLAHLRTCVTKSNPTAYSIDIDHLTPVQGMVLEILKSIPTILPEIVSELVESLHGFVTLAYNHTPDHSRSNLTYVALSKTAMDLLESFVNEHVKRSDIDSTKLVTNACAALKVPIHLKYDWKIEGKGSPPWTKATMTAMAILEPFVSTGKASEASRETSSEFWDVVVDISKGITTADCNSCDNWLEVPKDQSFDTDAFRNIRKLVIPALGSSSIPDAIRRKYAESVFENSFIHEPHPDDLARPDQELLEGLISEHIGRVQDLPPSPRSELSYLLLDELFTLVSVHDGSPEWIRLAQAAAPYLVLRTGLTLKAYIMDQPLRGRMPQPWSQKEEMFYIIGKLIDLDTEPKAIPAAPGVTSEHKKHLHRLYPLVMKALKAAWRDEEMVDALQEFLDAVGNDFGV